MNSPVQSWYDVALQQPVDPRILIANCYLDGNQGSFARNNAFAAAGWAASSLTAVAPVVCTSLHTDDALAVAEAAQWTFTHQGINNSATNPPCLQKVVFLRGGTNFEMTFSINFGLATHSAVLLSFRDNAATPGDFAGSGAGTIPVIAFPNTYTGIKTFKVTLKMLGSFVMGLRSTAGGAAELFEMEWNVVR